MTIVWIVLADQRVTLIAFNPRMNAFIEDGGRNQTEFQVKLVLSFFFGFDTSLKTEHHNTL